ncbi:MAG: A/G-specific adenine glycosylase [Oscillospiraceae bacterium]|nr:A/G-specific adenine glycosylase [Oscillospiraceae bacterium]
MDLLPLPNLLLPWYAENRRDLPWRRDREPYHVWLSEIMLQQTRVEAVRGYYLRFLEALPTVRALAVCDEDRLHKLWEGLGYYARVRNLKKAAQVICETYDGVFPTDYAAARALPGIGDYTAGAICSICYGQSTPAVDGNVLRVVTRLEASFDSITSPGTKRAITEELREIYPAGRCGDFTQALMELGAMVCLPNGEPHCTECPAAALCLSRAEALYRTIPVKERKKPRRVEKKTVFLLRCGDLWAVRKRTEPGLLSGLWEFPNVPGILTAQEALRQAEAWECHPRELIKSVGKTHIFTHIQWELTGYYLDCGEASPRFRWADRTALDRDVSLPTAFRQFREA